MFLTSTLETGGAEVMLDHILESPGDLSFRPIICCTYKPGFIGRRLIERGITVYHSLAINKLDFKIIPRLEKIIRQEKVLLVYDVVSGNNTFVLGLMVSKFTGIAFVNAFHNARYQSVAVRLYRRACIKYSDCVIALSESHREFIARYYAVQPDKIRIIPNGIDISRFPLNKSTLHYRAKLDLPLDKPIVAIIATLRPLKAHEVFLEAAQKVLMNSPDTQFLVVGDGPERNRLELLADRLGIKASVHFLGQRTDIPEILSCIDVSVLCSHQETFPIILLESMAASKAVVATNVGFINELVQDKETGILVQPGDVEGLSEGILTLIGNPELSRSMGAAGRHRVDYSFSLQNTINAFESMVLESIKNLKLI